MSETATAAPGDPQAGMTSWEESPSVEKMDLAQLQASVESLADGPYPPAAQLQDSPCDLVMKGGITSGVVYPLAACQLAKQYRFHNIGGASAGAIGAVMIAAAECGRDHDGFNNLAKIPTALGPRLGEVFTPTPHTKTAHRVMMAALAPVGKSAPSDKEEPPKPSKARIARRILPVLLGAEKMRVAIALVVAAIVGVLGVLVAAGLPHSPGDWVRLVVVDGVWTLLIGGGAALVWAAVATALSAQRGMVRNGFGVCIGSDGPNVVARDDDDPGPFTDWMHRQIQLIAAVGARAEHDGTTPHPLTFGDLKRADINLQVMTTNLTLGRPQSFPFADEQGGLRYLFDPVELAEYFPPDVVAWLVQCAPDEDTRQTESDSPEPDPDDENRKRLRWLSKADDLPIILAARLSLSFPGLISAVPLWALDKDKRARRCWMSDGGLTANFPVHFFDSPLPGCPTFAIDLQHYPTAPAHACDDVYYPADECDPTPSFQLIKGMTGFGSALLTTMQYWSDTSQAALPGYRDRIVQVRLTDTEGGMNLQMPELRVLRVAVKGARGAIKIAGVPGNRAFEAGFDLERHQWARYLSLMSRLQVMVGKMPERWRDAASPGASSGYEALVRKNDAPPVSAGCNRYDRERWWRDGAIDRTNRLLRFVETVDDDGEPFSTSAATGTDANGSRRHVDFDGDPAPPTPRPDLRMAPHI